MASATVAIPAGLDLAAAVLAARTAADHCFCFEQPARDAHAVCALGAAAVVQDSGPDRAGRAAAVAAPWPAPPWRYPPASTWRPR
ncbi:MAG TPA: hypothetical protein VFD31_09570, partial [Thermoleophilaceae bacterium]|nr:hypothetical protein [Thermoleophilaceae bacterium]